MFSLIVPTINRPNFLKLYIDFLSIQNFDGEIIIGDSSSEENFKIFEDFYKTKKLNFKVVHIEKKNKGLLEVIKELVPLIKFKYSMYICDDDYILYKNIKKCINFLEKNKNYSVAGGVNIGLILNNNDIKVIDFIDELNFQESLSEKPSLRLKKIANKYSVIAYSVSRSDELKKRWLNNNKMTNRDIAVEIHPCFHMAVEGKVKKINNIFVFRLLHSMRILGPSLLLDRYLNPNYFSTVEESINILSELMSLNENIDYETANKFVKIYYNDYLRLSLNSKLKKKKNLFLFAFFRIKRILLRIFFIVLNRNIKYLLIYKYKEKKIFEMFYKLLKKNF
tara:strand:- start:940 stop:1947 length:1008 start_codon:yes stop_codon:yes gene_type:complete